MIPFAQKSADVTRVYGNRGPSLNDHWILRVERIKCMLWKSRENMSARPQDLPDYVRPPVNEVVIGASFAKLRLLQSHIGLFWSTIRDRYVSQQDAMPIEAAVEWFEGRPIEVPALDPSMLPLRRSWFIDREPQWLLQLQEDRLIHNWRRVTPDDTYPHFEECLSRFMSVWDTFRTFCDTEHLGSSDAGQLEVTYINHIDEQGAWNGLGDVANVLPDLSWRQGQRVLPPLMSSLGRLHFGCHSILRGFTSPSRVPLGAVIDRVLCYANYSSGGGLPTISPWRRGC